jgi:hypothetical protein
MGSGAIDNGMLISHRISSSTTDAVSMVALLRCWRDQAAGQIESARSTGAHCLRGC